MASIAECLTRADEADEKIARFVFQRVWFGCRSWTVGRRACISHPFPSFFAERSLLRLTRARSC